MVDINRRSGVARVKHHRRNIRNSDDRTSFRIDPNTQQCSHNKKKKKKCFVRNTAVQVDTTNTIIIYDRVAE